MKTIKNLSLILALNTTMALANVVTFDSKNAVTTSVSPDNRNSKDPAPVEIIDTERGFDPSVMPVDVALRFNFAGEATDAEIILSGAIKTNAPGKLSEMWVAAPSLSKVYKVKIKKGQNALTLIDLPIHTAAENFIDKRKKGQKGTAIGLTIKVLVNNTEVGSIQKVYPTHLL